MSASPQDHRHRFHLPHPHLPHGLVSFPGKVLPWIERAGPDVEVLASHDGHGVFVRQGNVVGTSFHPELTADPRVHRYFLEIVEAA